MNTLEKLIAKLCPNGVEYKPVGKICVRHHGTNITAGRMTELSCYNGEVRVFAAGSTIADVPGDAIPTDDIIKEVGIIVKSRGYVGFEYYEKPFTHKNELWSYTSGSCDIDLKFVYYYLLTKTLALQALARSKSVKLPQLATGDTDALEIPLPPLPVQKEIVRVLDEMAGLIDALEEELVARKKQYEYYRETLVGCENNVPNGPIVSISECIQKIENIKWNGNKKTFHYIELSSIDNDRHRVGGTVTIDARTAPSRAQQIVKKDDVLFGTTRPLLRRYCMIPEAFDGQICSTGFCVLRANTDKVLPSWLYYVISTNAFISQVERLQRGGGYPAIANNDLCSCKILLPSLAAQKQIVKALNDLDTLCNSMTDGLPGEIALRKQQYEFYRDKLLTFKKAV